MQIMFFDIEYLMRVPLLAHVLLLCMGADQNGKKLQYERLICVCRYQVIMYVFLLICKLANILMSVELKKTSGKQ